MVAVADVESGPKVGDGRSTASDSIPGFDEQRLDTRPRQIGSCDETVMTTSDDYRIDNYVIAVVFGTTHTTKVACECAQFRSRSSDSDAI